MPVENDELLKRVEGLEAALATQTATLAGAQSTQAAVEGGMQATNTAMQAGTMATMVAGSVSLIVGIFLGMAIVKSK